MDEREPRPEGAAPPYVRVGGLTLAI